MSNIKFKLNSAGVRELLRSEEIAGICMEHARRVQASAGPDYEAEERHYPERTGAAVRPANAAGHFDNLRNNTLLKALGGGK